MLRRNCSNMSAVRAFMAKQDAIGDFQVTSFRKYPTRYPIKHAHEFDMKDSFSKTLFTVIQYWFAAPEKKHSKKNPKLFTHSNIFACSKCSMSTRESVGVCIYRRIHEWVVEDVRRMVRASSRRDENVYFCFRCHRFSLSKHLAHFTSLFVGVFVCARSLKLLECLPADYVNENLSSNWRCLSAILLWF